MKQLTLVPIGGLANRMLSITSAIGFCKEHKVFLKVYWFKDWGMGADFHALFELNSSVENVEIIDAKWSDYRFDRPRKRNLWIPYLWQYFAFEKRIYEHKIYAGLKAEEISEAMQKHRSLYLVHYHLFHESEKMYNSIRPIASINSSIEKQTNLFSQYKVIGIHIRRGDHPIPTEKSPLSLFINRIHEELEINPDTKFYVASDSKEEKEKLIERFGNSIITSSKEVRRDTVEGITDALAELYILSRTTKIYGSLASSYSLLAAKLSDIPIKILSL